MLNEETLAIMLTKAKIAMANAYAPYSKFKVGVCIRTSHDQLFIGCNNENAAYPLCMCAESTAIGNMITHAGAQYITDVLIIASSDKPCTPCGSCRQRTREFADAKTCFHMFDQTGNNKLTMTLGELLPESFGPDFL